MLYLFIDWRAWLIVSGLAIITLISSVAKYRIGEVGMHAVREQFPQVSEERWDRIGGYFNRWGAPVVILSFLPVLAWIIPPAAAAFGVPFRPYLAWAFLAKMVRYWILLLIVANGLNLIVD